MTHCGAGEWGTVPPVIAPREAAGWHAPACAMSPALSQVAGGLHKNPPPPPLTLTLTSDLYPNTNPNTHTNPNS